jgi:DNA-binding transcriptional ArsR family regulator
MVPDRLSATLAALADPTRRGILARLATGDASVSELAEPYDMSLAAVSKHLKVLEGAGLIIRGWNSQARSRQAGNALSAILQSCRRRRNDSLERATCGTLPHYFAASDNAKS